MDLKSKILERLESLEAPFTLIHQFERAGEAEFSNLAERVDSSPYELTDWLHALIQFSHWEHRTTRMLTLSQKFEYLSCCVEGAAGTMKLLTLSDLLNDYLKTHGVK
jgi:hypothetical protein